MEYYVEPPKNWWSMRGTLLHKILEQPGIESLLHDMWREVQRAIKSGGVNEEEVRSKMLEISERVIELASILPRIQLPNWQSETEYEYYIGNIDGKDRYLRGTIDVLRPETGEILDYKTIGDRGMSIIKDGAKKDHITQFNMYRLLVERGYPVGQRDTYKPIKIEKITAFYMSMMQIARTGGLMLENTDWLIDGGSGQDNLKKHPNLVGEPEILSSKEYMKLKRGKKWINATPDDMELQTSKKFRLTYAVPDVPLLDLDKMEALVRETVPILVGAFGHGVMPPMCPPEMRQWKCTGYCPDQIRNACDAHNLTTGEIREVEVPEDTGIPIESL